ncbi:hypothetical protein SAMN04488024_1181 [Pedobacter soli]|uniref:HEPN AbiU2-like domain-containing protein n=2 Tax=Pedobacter soli TaxID=390242 RepID=A0A1G7C5J9_9SPHI|nr:hypothetical protein SAMN04488024_1181 [Pedobacter soli]
MTNQITPLDESVHILNVINNNIIRYHRALCSLPDYHVDPNIVMTINTMSFENGCILVTSYFDEYHGHFIRLLNEQQRRYINPYFKRIKNVLNLFPDIKEFRNQVVAHNLRVKNKSVPTNKSLTSFVVPQTIIEFSIVIECIKYITTIINRMFPLAMKKVVMHLSAEERRKSVVLKSPLTPAEAETILVELIRDLQIIASNQDIPDD